MSRLRDERGTSLVEVAVVAALVMVVLVPVLRYFDSAVRGANELQRSTWQLGDARVTVDAMTRELRQAYSGKDTVPEVTVTPDHQQLVVLSPTTATPFRLRRITYQVRADGWLWRTVQTSDQTSCPLGAPSCVGYGPDWTFDRAGASQQVLQVQAGSFTLVGAAGAPQTVTVSLTAPGTRGRAPQSYTTTVQLRNA